VLILSGFIHKTSDFKLQTSDFPLMHQSLHSLTPNSTQDDWLALMIGNSHLHWAYFKGNILTKTWDTSHEVISPPESCPLYIASVVASQTAIWETFPQSHLITLEQIPLKELYPTLGIDRALGVWGMGNQWGFPCLMIDGGTALTLTGVGGDRVLVGGVILPGLGLQFEMLHQKTAALPNVSLPETLPKRWGLNTPDAITSGVIYPIVAGIKGLY
jgi:type III pantothenate kinase